MDLTRTQFHDVDGEEFGVQEPVYVDVIDMNPNLTPKFYCHVHGPAYKTVELTPEMVQLAVRQVRDCDREQQARQNNFVNFPMRMPTCEECDDFLIWPNRRVSVA